MVNLLLYIYIVPTPLFIFNEYIYGRWVQNTLFTRLSLRLNSSTNFIASNPQTIRVFYVCYKLQPFEILVFQITLTLNPEKKRLDLSNVAAK